MKGLEHFYIHVYVYKQTRALVVEKIELPREALNDDTWTFVEWHVVNISMCNVSFTEHWRLKGYSMFAVLIMKMVSGSKYMNSGLFMTCRQSLF